jgi:hypothetical protein
MRTNRYAEGTRVEIRQGSLPMNHRLIGREGLVVALDAYEPGRYGIQLDDEETLREFAEDELVPLVDDPKPRSDRGSAGPAIKG